MTNDTDELVSSVIAGWQKKLLQIDRRNNALYFKPGRAVEIINIAPDTLDEDLIASRSGLSFAFTEPRRRRGRGFLPPEPDEEESEVEEPVVVPGDIDTSLNIYDLLNRLKILKRKDKEWEDEQGINVLFLAIGILEWVDQDGEAALSPLILIPCDLNQNSPRDPYYLQRESDDAEGNATLIYALSEQGVQLQDYNGESLSEYIQSVADAVSHHSDWTVTSAIYLSTFSYSKLPMWKDLEKMRIDGISHPLVRSLAGDDRDQPAGSLPDELPDERALAGGRLDDLLDVKDQHVVLAADFSQLKAIELARSRANMVIHGPPGTGKSQTISNIIAALLADGQRVLFVSEKTAALDVVKRRLEECQLGVFCLDLHSERGKKSSVYEQLRESVDDQQLTPEHEFTYEALGSKRHQLNLVVRALHEVREPLGRTVFEMQGKFAQLRALPVCEFRVEGAANFDEAWLVKVQEIAERVSRREIEFSEHHTSRWIPLISVRSSLQLADSIRSDMTLIEAAVSALQPIMSRSAQWFGVEPPQSLDESDTLAKLANHLAIAPGVPGGWLDDHEIERLRSLAEALQASQERREELIGMLTSAFGSRDVPLDFKELASKLDLPQASHHALRAFLGDTWLTAVIHRTDRLHRSAEAICSSVDEIVSRFPELADNKGDFVLETWGQLDQSIANAEEVCDLAPVPEGWTHPEGIKFSHSERKAGQELLEELQTAEQELAECFEESILDVVDEGLLNRYETDYQSFWKRLAGSYRRDQRLLKGHTPDKRNLPVETAIGGLKTATQVKRLREKWSDKETSLQHALGHRFSGRDTRWQSIGQDIDRVVKLVGATAKTEKAFLADLLADPGTPKKLERSVSDIRAARDRVSEAIEFLPEQDFVSPAKLINTARKRAQAALKPLSTVTDVMERVRHHLQVSLVDFGELNMLVTGGVELEEIEAGAGREAGSLQEAFGARFQGFETDWHQILAALSWTRELLALLPSDISTQSRLHAEEPKESEEYLQHARAIAVAIESCAADLKRTEERFDPALTPWGGWNPAPFGELRDWSQDLRVNADTASDWIAYRTASEDLNDLVGEDVVSQLREVTNSAELIPRIMMRRIIEAWLDAVLEGVPLIRDFARQDHDEIRRQFEKLDRDLPRAARSQIRKTCFSAYPDRATAGLTAGQLGTLRAQLSRRRGQLSVRKLVLKIPNLLQTLKPVFLMSPLAVSKFLPREDLDEEAITFDAVIFDEASQVFPEDAVPAIARGVRTIVVGDAEQLPPSNLFRRSFGDDFDNDDTDDDDDERDAFVGVESILDAMKSKVGRNVAEAYLGMHYRSRHDSLIRFSNHYFYKDRLLVFPTPYKGVSSDGIIDVFLPDARYEPKGGPRGGNVNRVEAERAVDEIFNLMRTQPDDQSIGVVTFNKAQSDLIRDLVELRRLEERDVDERFSEDRKEPFFVKNLENVQGDERDHIILSVVYGRTAGSGAVPNRFGPINNKGGERRLNVAVTRARRSMTVIHSLRPTDIRAEQSEQKGARLLRRYLEYVADPIRAFEGQITVDPAAETESPFEEAVEAAILKEGFRVDRQIGVSGYRIDLAILSEDGTRYDLGVECDGATYHSAPAARDRDWLRESVLVGLGWSIHRVWSTSWIRNPKGELDAILESLSKARARERVRGVDESSANATDNESASTIPALPPEMQPEVETPAADTRLLFEEYESADLAGIRVSDHPQDDSWETLEKLVLRVTSTEAPVHRDLILSRIRVHYKLGRAGTLVRRPIEGAIALAIQQDKLATAEGEFVTLADHSEPVAPRRPEADGAPRKIEHISIAELQAGLLRILEAVYGSERDDLVVEAARQFGYNRTGVEISSRLEQAIDELLEQERLVLVGAMLSIPRS